MKEKKAKGVAEYFKEVIDSTYVRVDGILVERGVSKNGEQGFYWAGQFYENIDDVKQEMNGLSSVINLSIINPNGEVKRLDKTHTDGYFKGKSPYISYKESETERKRRGE
jgi:hypothetical protein